MSLKRAVAALFFGAFLALMPAQVEAQIPPPPAPSEWEAFTRRFMAADGRIVDTANRGISHSEGQGYAMVFAVHFNDRARFDQLWRWTRRNLARPRDALAAWRFDPSSSLRVSDMNNATDGDIFIAWGLLLAAERWNEPEYRAAAVRIAADILRCCVVEFRQRVVMLPGAHGFQDAQGVVVNLSYYAFPALRALSRAVPDPRWARLENDGVALIRDGGFGRWGLPPDWLLLPADGSPPRPAARWPARFSWDAVRVPLNLAWQQQDIGLVAPARRFWDDPTHPRRPPAWVDLRTGEMPPYAGHAGVRAVHALVLARTGGNTGAPLRVADAPDYFGSALVLQSRIAPYMRTEALGLAPPDTAPDQVSRLAWLSEAARSVWSRVSSGEPAEAEASAQSQWARNDFVEPAPVRGVVIGVRNTVPPR